MKTLPVMAEVDVSKLLDLIDEDITEIVTLATDAEITRQFETIQKELEGILKNYIKDQLTVNYTMEDLEASLKEIQDERPELRS
jgi:molecular chaperone DnaK (HSP70)